MSPFDLVVLGDANPDLILTGDVVPRFGQAEQLLNEAVLTVGGSGAITACGAAKLGLAVAFCGVVGDDLFGSYMREQLSARGVNLDGMQVRPSARTGLTVVLSDAGDRASLTLPGTIAVLDAASIDPEPLADARHIHVSQYFMQEALRPGLPDLFQDARDRGTTTSLDPNWDPSGAWDSGLHALLPFVDVFMPNAQEAGHIAGASEAGQAASVLASASGGLVVVKDGEKGAHAARGDVTVSSPPFSASSIDPTGAGDSFDAGFLAAYLNGEDLSLSLRVANACGALSTNALGGVDAQPTMDEVLAFIGGSFV